MAQELKAYKMVNELRGEKQLLKIVNDAFIEIEGVFQSKEEAEDFTKDCNAKYLRYSYELFEEEFKEA